MPVVAVVKGLDVIEGHQERGGLVGRMRPVKHSVLKRATAERSETACRWQPEGALQRFRPACCHWGCPCDSCGGDAPGAQALLEGVDGVLVAAIAVMDAAPPAGRWRRAAR